MCPNCNAKTGDKNPIQIMLQPSKSERIFFLDEPQCFNDFREQLRRLASVISAQRYALMLRVYHIAKQKPLDKSI